MKIRFNDIIEQMAYEGLIRQGMDWRVADAKVKRMFKEYDNGEL